MAVAGIRLRLTLAHRRAAPTVSNGMRRGIRPWLMEVADRCRQAQFLPMATQSTGRRKHGLRSCRQASGLARPKAAGQRREIMMQPHNPSLEEFMAHRPSMAALELRVHTPTMVMEPLRNHHP